MAEYQFHAVSLRTGRVVARLPLVDVSAQRRLDVGEFSASLTTPTAAPDGPNRAADLDKCRALLNATTPDVMTVIVVRDGTILGEWWLRGRDRSTRPMPLSGKELKAWFVEAAAVDGFKTLTNADEMTVAKALVDNALAKPFAPPITVEAPALSGNVIAKAEYLTGSDYIGNIVDQLGTAIDGFDWWIDTDWDTTQVLPTVKRTLRFAHPQRGRLLQARIHIPARTTGQSGVSMGMTEDGSKVATTVYMTGTGEGDTQLVARGLNADLLISYPSLDWIDSRAQYDDQSLLNAQAAAAAAAARTPELPQSVLVRADGDMQLGLYQPGDTVPLKMDPWENFPDGYDSTVRIVGYTITPPAGGRTDIVNIEIERGDASVFDT